MVGGRAATATPGRTDKGCELLGSSFGRGRFRGKNDSQVSLHPASCINYLWRGAIATVLPPVEAARRPPKCSRDPHFAVGSWGSKELLLSFAHPAKAHPGVCLRTILAP